MIRKISFLEEFLVPVGLAAHAQTMDRLGKLVVLAGPNGAGKTRYLQVLQQVVDYAQRALWHEVALEARLPQSERLVPESVATAVVGKSRSVPAIPELSSSACARRPDSLHACVST